MGKLPQLQSLRATRTECLSAYRRIQHEVAYHMQEICRISLSSSPDIMFVHSVQPPLVAGQFPEEIQERELVVD